MTFAESIRTVLWHKFARFSGRAARSEYWWFQLFYLLYILSAGAIVALLGYQPPASPETDPQFDPTNWFHLPLIIPMLSVTVRRFHDRNLSTWLGLAASIIPFGFDFVYHLLTGYIYAILLLLSVIAAIIPLWPGTKGPNRFGEDPLQRTVSPEIFA